MKRKLILAASLASVALAAIGLEQANARENAPVFEARTKLAAPVKLHQAGQIALKATSGLFAQIG